MTENVATDPQPAPPAAGKPPSRVVVKWKGEGTMAFEGRKAKGGPTITVDNTGKAEPGPVDTLLIALAATRWLETLLFEVTPHDPATFAGIAALLLVIALLACYIPARRAARVDPLTVLRE